GPKEASRFPLLVVREKVEDFNPDLTCYAEDDVPMSQLKQERDLRLFRSVLGLIAVLATCALVCFSIGITTNSMVIIAPPPQYPTTDNAYGLYQFCYTTEENLESVKKCGVLGVNCELDCSLFDDVETCNAYDIVQNCDSFFALRIISSFTFLLVLVPPIVMIVLTAMGYNPKRTAVSATIAYTLSLVLCVLFITILYLTELNGHKDAYDRMNKMAQAQSVGNSLAVNTVQRTNGFPKLGYSFWALFGCIALQLVLIAVVVVAYSKNWIMFAYDRKRPSIATLEDVVLESG
ncbi:hypothetical protein SARC_14191, partial [Sphaeroforma arctica JP610]